MTLQLGPVIGKVGGAQVEEIPVSMSGSGTQTLATIDAGGGAYVWLDGTRTGLQNSTLAVGGRSYLLASNSARVGGGGFFTGTVAVTLSSPSAPLSFEGTVYVIRT